MSKVDKTKKQLWDMANSLRGNMDASEYRNYILGFMFYRFLSERQEKYLFENEVFDHQPDSIAGINDEYAKEANDDLPDYLEDIAGSLGYAINPQYTWKTIVNEVNSNTIRPETFQDMFDSFNNNLRLNNQATQDFTGVFSDINLGNSRLGNTTAARAKALTAIVKVIDQVDFKDENGRDVLADIYQYLIKQFASSSGKKAGEFYTPHEVSKVLAKLATADFDQDNLKPSVYDFACGSGSLLLTVQDEIKHRVFYYGQELNTTTYNLARMNLMMNNVPYDRMNLRNADTLEDDWPDGVDAQGVDHPRDFDVVVANPPYSEHWDNNERKMKDPRFKDYGALAPKTKADYAFLLHGLYHLKTTGTMAIVLPHGVLFRGAKEETIRKALLKKNQIDAVIGMPANLFYSTGIPTVILVLKKQKTNDNIMFIDASKGFAKEKNQNTLRPEDIDKIVSTYKARKGVKRYAHVASMQEIKDNDYNLNIPRYVDTFVPEPPVDLQKVAKNLTETQKEIDQNEKELTGMLKDLTSDDQDTMAGLHDIIQFLGGEDK